MGSIVKRKTFKKTLSHSFLLPLIKNEFTHIQNNDSHVHNVFLYDTDLPQYKYSWNDGEIINQHLIIVQQNRKELAHIEWLNKFKQSNLYVTHYLICRDVFVCIVIRFPREFSSEYAMFLNGEYSSFSFQAKSLIKSHYFGISTKNYVRQTLDKGETLRQMWKKDYDIDFDREQEYWYKPVFIYKPDSKFNTGEVLDKQVKKLLITTI